MRPPGIQRPQVGGLLNFILLMQSLPQAGNLGKIPVEIQRVAGAGGDFAVHGLQKKMSQIINLIIIEFKPNKKTL